MTTLPGPRPLEEVVLRACRAPSVHNTQPWLWRLEPRRVLLYADDDRRLRHTDPEGRDLVLSCGAALHHLQVAARALGWRPEVLRMPAPEDPRHLATVTVTASPATSSTAQDLDLLDRRRTDRRRHPSWPVPEHRLEALADVARRWGADLQWVRERGPLGRLRELVEEADAAQRADRGYLAELREHVGERPDGLPLEALPAATGPADRRFPPGRLDDRDQPGDPEAFLLLTTAADDRGSVLRAGEALSALWLHAVADGLNVVPLSQVTESERTRRAVASEVLGGACEPQLLLRVAWPPAPAREVPPTPRRDLGEVLLR